MTTETAEKFKGAQMPEKYENKSKEDGKMVKLKIILKKKMRDQKQLKSLKANNTMKKEKS